MWLQLGEAAQQAIVCHLSLHREQRRTSTGHCPCVYEGKIGRQELPIKPMPATSACRAHSGRDLESAAYRCSLVGLPFTLMSANSLSREGW